jgi:hypothetical protein
VDEGHSFTVWQIPGYEKSDFRDVHAFSADQAVVMSSGTPALILRTSDAGRTWNEVFRDNRKEIFLDAMDFWDLQHGLVIGDPVDGRFFMLRTDNGGQTFRLIDTSMIPVAYLGEALFASSGTALRCWNDNRFGFVTGGEVSRYITGIITPDSLIVQKVYGLPINAGNHSSGAFSFVALNENVLVVGGDYANDSAVANNVVTMIHDKDLPECLQYDGFIARKAEEDVTGYRSAVEVIRNGTVFVATGTNGVDIGTRTWKRISNEGYHVVVMAAKGDAVYLAGPKGRLARLHY